MKKVYVNKWICPKCNKEQVTLRRKTTAGKQVSTYCMDCHKQVTVRAGVY